MIKDIVVNLSVGERPGPAGDYAISVAAAFDAHLAGIAFLYDPIVPVSGAGYIPAEVIETQERENAAASKAALDRFSAACDRAGVAAEPLTLSASFAGVGDQFGRIARRFDLSIVGQAEPETKRRGRDHRRSRLVRVPAARSSSFPTSRKHPLKLDRVMLCWDGSRAAARAIADAMPFSRRRAGRGRHRRQRAWQAGRNRRRRHGATSRPARARG